LLLSDEVQSGFYRTGRNMWGYQLHGFTPDLATLGKPMGNGYPMGAVIYSSEMQPSLSTGNRYFNTFAGNPVAAAAGQAVLDVLQDEEIGAHVAYMNDILRDALARQFDAFSGVGLGWSVDVGSAAVADEIVEHLFGQGILAGTAGPARDRIRIRPPLIFGPESAERLISALKTSPI
jgi:4-aminobutyrate aminotransferase-like enzyme